LLANKGYEVGKDTYTKISENEKVKSIGGAVYSKTKGAAGVATSFLSSLVGKKKVAYVEDSGEHESGGANPPPAQKDEGADHLLPETSNIEEKKE